MLLVDDAVIVQEEETGRRSRKSVVNYAQPKLNTYAHFSPVRRMSYRTDACVEKCVVRKITFRRSPNRPLANRSINALRRQVVHMLNRYLLHYPTIDTLSTLPKSRIPLQPYTRKNPLRFSSASQRLRMTTAPKRNRRTRRKSL